LGPSLFFPKLTPGSEVVADTTVIIAAIGIEGRARQALVHAAIAVGQDLATGLVGARSARAAWDNDHPCPAGSRCCAKNVGLDVEDIVAAERKLELIGLKLTA
jgi:hypothetical protein